MLAVINTTSYFNNSSSSATHFWMNNRLELSIVILTNYWVFTTNIVINIIWSMSYRLISCNYLFVNFLFGSITVYKFYIIISIFINDNIFFIYLNV